MLARSCWCAAVPCSAADGAAVNLLFDEPFTASSIRPELFRNVPARECFAELMYGKHKNVTDWFTLNEAERKEVGGRDRRGSSDDQTDRLVAAADQGFLQ